MFDENTDPQIWHIFSETLYIWSIWQKPETNQRFYIGKVVQTVNWDIQCNKYLPL